MGRCHAFFLTILCAPVISASATALETYLEAEFDDGVCFSGEGEIPATTPLPCGGLWSEGVENGIGPPGASAIISIANDPACDPPAPDNSVFIDPGHGLRGTTQGLRFLDLNCGSTVTNFYVTGAAATDSQVYWIDYSFKIDPDGSGLADLLGELKVFDTSGSDVMRLWHGLHVPDTEPEFRYKFSISTDPEEPPVVARNISPTTINDEWRALIKIDPVADTQTHWLWKNGDAIVGFVSSDGDDVFGRPYPLRQLQDTILHRLAFRTRADTPVDFFVDGLRVASEPPRTIPIELKALPLVPGQIKLRWLTLGTSEAGFSLQRAADGSGEWTTLPAVIQAGSTEHVDDTAGVQPVKYNYRLRAEYSDGTQSPWTNVASAVPVYQGKPLFGWLNLLDFLPPPPFEPGDPTNAGTTTASFQNALDALAGGADGPQVLYIPDGAYAVNDTLHIEGKAGVQLIGESTDGSVVQWTGDPGTGPDDTVVMFHAEGNRDAQFRNITWDGNCYQTDANGLPVGECFVVAFDESYCGNVNNGDYETECNALAYQDPGVGRSDSDSAQFHSVFKNSYVGLRIGHYMVQDSEITVRRCRFEDNFVGTSIEDFNALSIWFWDGKFERNYVGVANDITYVRQKFDASYEATCSLSGQPCSNYVAGCDRTSGDFCSRRWGGDFSVVRGRFEDSGFADLFVQPTGRFVFRDSYSSGSDRFFYAMGKNSTAAQWSLINNRIEDDSGVAIEIRTPGPFLLADNLIYSDGESVPVTLTSVEPEDIDGDGDDDVDIDLIALNNGYSLDEGVEPYGFEASFRLREFDDHTIVNPGSPAFSIPPMPAVQDLLTDRPVFTVADDALAQEVIDLAAANQPAIVHFPGGSHDVEQPALERRHRRTAPADRLARRRPCDRAGSATVRFGDPRGQRRRERPRRLDQPGASFRARPAWRAGQRNGNCPNGLRRRSARRQSRIGDADSRQHARGSASSPDRIGESRAEQRGRYFLRNHGGERLGLRCRQRTSRSQGACSECPYGEVQTLSASPRSGRNRTGRSQHQQSGVDRSPERHHDQRPSSARSPSAGPGDGNDSHRRLQRQRRSRRTSARRASVADDALLLR
jgi:hypothetical protein